MAATLESKRPRSSAWAWAPVLLLGSLLAGLGTMLTIATRDPSFAVEENYYQKAVHWDREREQQRENQRLGYRFEVAIEEAPAGANQRVVATLTDALGTKLSGATVELTAFHNARAAQHVRCRLSESAPGVYRCALPMARPGLWELRFSSTRSGARFTHVTRLDVNAPQKG